MGGCQNFGLFLGALNIRCRIRDPKRDHNFDNHPYKVLTSPYKGPCLGSLIRSQPIRLAQGKVRLTDKLSVVCCRVLVRRTHENYLPSLFSS